MKILYDWLKEFVEVPFTPRALAERLSLAGIAVEGVSETSAGPLLDLDLTINRPDCLAHYGVAREVAALGRNPLLPVSLAVPALARKPLPPVSIALPEASENAASATRVEIESPDLCGRFTARVLRGVKVQPSPDWLRKRLEALGQASINNVVDATNYVMLELGHPMHAYDLDRLAERRIIVRRARSGEKIRTLDGIERTLSTDICVIADAARAVGIGGIMGGAETEIGFATRNVLLEAAWFDPISIRRSSKALGLRTEASTRFERGADPEMAETASRRCAALIRELAGGEVLAGVVDVYPARREPLILELSRKELLRLMGADVPDAEIEAILGALGFAPKRTDETRGSADAPLARWQCRQPSWRQDVTREVDLIEEVARHYGLDKFPPRLHAAKQPAARLPYAEAEDRLRERLIGLGYREIVSIPLVNEAEDALFRPGDVIPARVANPLAEDASLMRSTGLVSMAHALAWNLNHGQRSLRLFEIGRAYRLRNGTPEEMRIVTIGATGLAREQGVAESAREYGFAGLKGDLDQIGDLAGGFGWNGETLPWQQPARAGKILLANAGLRRLGNEASGQRWFVTVGTTVVGGAGELAPRVADKFKLRQDVFLAEWVLDPFFEGYSLAREARKYQPISRFPAVERDFSLILNDGTSFASVREAIADLRIPEVISIEAVDLFRGRNIPPGKFSLLVRVTFQSQEATLTETQLSDYSTRIISALEQKLGAALRTA
jgi:phenylalanyl-tRNA synthetase beta chain